MHGSNQHYHGIDSSRKGVNCGFEHPRYMSFVCIASTTYAFDSPHDTEGGVDMLASKATVHHPAHEP
jgi:hypothetical protein